MKKLSFIASWLGLITTPYIIRRVAKGNNWSGYIKTLHSTGNDSIGYYIFPGILYPPEAVIKRFISPKRYDLHLIHYGHKDYEPDLAAEAVANHIEALSYKTVRIISFGMGDQLLSTLGYYLSDLVREGRIEVVTIDSVPNPDFINSKYLKALRSVNPVLMAIRIISGWIVEIPCFKKDHCWRSPAEVIEQLSSLTSYNYDYTDDPILDCIKACIKDARVFYDPENAAKLFDTTFNYIEDNDPKPRLYFNTGKLCNIRDKATIEGYNKVFNAIGWKF
ncbi:hypothetical protein IKG48_01115 [Candidatus Saccharibacteria bacterium]|nr:hypothetical protein [Candidatus Saccharibacteria bacterium]